MFPAMNASPPFPSADAMTKAMAYHEASKHHPDRYARGPGHLDWTNQPDPFRGFAGCSRIDLPLSRECHAPDFCELFRPGAVPSRPLDLSTLGLFFELSLALSAWKEIPGSRWSLRINPSSGNLHPTEGYAILPPLADVSSTCGVYHYLSREHALELRGAWTASQADSAGGFLVALTSIPWRESWKYGERAFRYCQHDIGHAIGALRFAAAVLGWKVRWRADIDDLTLARGLGLDRTEDFQDAETEIPELLLHVGICPDQPPVPFPVTDRAVAWSGKANRLSRDHVAWPAIDEVIEATVHSASVKPRSCANAPWPPPGWSGAKRDAAQIIRQRRSAVDFDGVTRISRATFLEILDLTLPRSDVAPFDIWDWPPCLHLILFVHRVDGLAPGLYAWVRDPGQLSSLKAACRPGCLWEPVEADAGRHPLFRLGPGDVREFSKTVSCHQDIAADSAFSLGMLARFEPVLREHGAGAYRRLFWEAGLIGQSLYLAAEAAGVRATGIGCFLDDTMHGALGISDRSYQSLYHFTVGGPVEDPRLRTLAPYAHLSGRK